MNRSMVRPTTRRSWDAARSNGAVGSSSPLAGITAAAHGTEHKSLLVLRWPDRDADTLLTADKGGTKSPPFRGPA